MASASLQMSIATPRSFLPKESLLLGHHKSILFKPVHAPGRLSGYTILRFSLRRQSNHTIASYKRKKKGNLTNENVVEVEAVDKDAFDALFNMLEDDLKNDDFVGDDGDNDDISEEELAKLEQELAEALADDEFLGALESTVDGDRKSGDEEEVESDNLEDDDDEEEEEEEENSLKLKNWQLKRLAYALKVGRRKTNIKNLAADLCLDRAVVLKLLREPPPNLVMLSATLPDKPISTIEAPEHRVRETLPLKAIPHTSTPKIEVKIPVHEMHGKWSARKRLKKVHVETMEKVYSRTKRPTNAIVSSIVHLTNLPRKRVVQWFEEKRAEEGVPENRVPYQRSSSPTIFTS